MNEQALRSNRIVEFLAEGETERMNNPARNMNVSLALIYEK